MDNFDVICYMRLTKNVEKDGLAWIFPQLG